MYTTMRRTLMAIGSVMLLGAGVSCSPDRIVANAPLPPDVPDPASQKTTAGALAAYYGALTEFNLAFGGFSNSGNTSVVAVSGLLVDELQPRTIGAPGGVTDPLLAIDSRNLPEYMDPALQRNAVAAGIYTATYDELQAVRGQANEARGLLTHYAPDSLRALTGQLYAIQGYTEVMLADLFCSGVPLSTIDFSGDYTLQPGSSTADVYRHAIALFDSALTLAADSERVVELARVGKARALLDLGSYAEAAQAAAAVPDGFAYLERYPAGFGSAGSGTQAMPNFAGVYFSTGWDFTESDREGSTGLDYRSSGDPRTSATAEGTNGHGVTIYHPDKYATDGSTPIVLADWVEARLIEAEAALQAGDTTTWLATLNHLRETAITPALPDTTDPGTTDARVNLTFRERAFWLFLTGHRLGDMRRLVRQYGRSESTVFPVGAYGADVTLPIPADEALGNPKFQGCLSRGA